MLHLEVFFFKNLWISVVVFSKLKCMKLFSLQKIYLKWIIFNVSAPCNALIIFFNKIYLKKYSFKNDIYYRGDVFCYIYFYCYIISYFIFIFTNKSYDLSKNFHSRYFCTFSLIIPIKIIFFNFNWKFLMILFRNFCHIKTECIFLFNKSPTIAGSSFKLST